MTDTTREAQLEAALRSVLRATDNVPWRDSTGLRLGDAVPSIERAKAMVSTSKTAIEGGNAWENFNNQNPFPNILRSEAGWVRETIWVAVHPFTVSGFSATGATIAVIEALEKIGIDLYQNQSDD